jgi:hypothetical protein
VDADPSRAVVGAVDAAASRDADRSAFFAELRRAFSLAGPS